MTELPISHDHRHEPDGNTGCLILFLSVTVGFALNMVAVAVNRIAGHVGIELCDLWRSFLGGC